MSDPKVIRKLRQVVYDTGIVLAEAIAILGEVDFDSLVGYNGATEIDNTFTLTAIAARLEHPRNVVLTVTAGTMTAGKVAVYGMGTNGRPTREEFTIAGAATYTGNVPFLTVDRVSCWGCVGAGADDEISIGAGAKIGLPLGDNEKVVSIIKERFNLVDIDTAGGTLNRAYGTYIPASTLDGAKALELWYTTDTTLAW
jgi:hypothetical protein